MTKIRLHGTDRQRCHALIRSSHRDRPGDRACRNLAVRGKERCRLHGGLSTGPRTVEGKARAIAAMVEGRKRWVERMEAEGRPFPRGWHKKLPEPDREARELVKLLDELRAMRRDAPPPSSPPRRRRGRPTKAEALAKLEAEVATLLPEAKSILRDWRARRSSAR